MTIKNLDIENYMCYYGNNTFEFAKGLNIVLGENGEGKTKLFEALEWLFRGNDQNLEHLVSAKKLATAEIGDQFIVSVALDVEQYNQQRSLKRFFTVTKESEQGCSTSKSEFEGIDENASGERERVDAEILLEQMFPAEIRRYSMFKGESELNIFDNDDALVNLINLFAEAKHYEKYAEKGTYLLEAAEKAVADDSKKNSKNQKEYKILEAEIADLLRSIAQTKLLLGQSQEEMEKIDTHLQEAEKYVDNAEALEIINTKIRNLENKISEKTTRLEERYTTYLFDDSWILVNFESIFSEYEQKVSALSKERRKLQSAHDHEQGRQSAQKEANKKATLQLFSGKLPLPDDIPSKQIMEELIQEEICKVCGREALKDSEAHSFMVKRLEDYLKLQDPQEDDVDAFDEILFSKDYTSELVNLVNKNNNNLKSLRGLKDRIRELFELNERKKLDTTQLNESLEKVKKDREKIIGTSKIGAEKLGSVLRNYNGMQDDKKKTNVDIGDYERRLENLTKNLDDKTKQKDGKDVDSANSFLVKTRGVLRDIERIFQDTKEEKFDSFIELLENKSNDYFSDVNKGAFTGNIRLISHRTESKTRIKVDLYEGDRKFFNPNQSLLTSMHIAVLFAISSLTKENRDEAFPLVLDAPTSSFGETKTGEFLNIISKTKNQIILLSKDFLGTEKDTGNLYVKPEFNNVSREKAFWVKLKRPFDSKDLRTINSNVINL